MYKNVVIEYNYYKKQEWGRKIYFQISLSFNFNSYAKVMTAAIIDVRNESTFNVIYFRM